MNAKGGVTVIVPTYNRKNLLGKTLSSLCFQTVTTDSFEVIVIDDGSTDATKQVVESFSDKICIRYFYQADKGFRVAKARNIGIFNAYFNTCLFLDSGVVANISLLEKHLSAHKAARGKSAFIGLAYGMEEFEPTGTYNVSFDSKSDLESFFESIKYDNQLIDCRSLSLRKFNISFDAIPIPWILFWTCHASCPTRALLEIGGFDEAFESWGGEDVEIAIRLIKAGIKIGIIEDAEVFHCPHGRPVVENKISSSRNCQYIYSKHPSKATFLLSQENEGWEKIVFSIMKIRESIYA